jgi:pyruvate/2-oxoglutarate dehydrogenase complex dihydrolipoamide acyltransferase (E2) component
MDTSTTAVILFEAARLLRKYPLLNACFVEEQACIYEPINIGVAIDSGQGLKVPVIHDADQKGLAEVTQCLRDLLLSYVDDQLTASMVAGGTFTLTDLSSEGALSFTPLINHGQSAILGIGAEYLPPGGQEGLFHLVLAFDHQIAEGRMAARFLAELRDRLVAYEQAMTGPEQAVPEPCCSRCQTPLAQLRQSNHHLLHSARADGTTALICTACLQGW